MAEKPVQSLDFRQLNPMDVSLPTVSPKFGEEVGKAMSQFGQIVQQGVLDYARTAKKIEDEQEIYGIRKEYLEASANKMGEYANTQSGGKVNGQLLSSDYKAWSEQWLKNRTGGLSRDLQLKVSRELENKMGGDYARLVPMQNRYATEKFLSDNVKRTEALGNTLLSLNPEIAYDEVDVMVQQNEGIMEDAAGNIINPDQAAEEMIKFNNTVAVNALENFSNNRRPDLIIRALGPYLQSEEAQNMLKANGISPEELGVDASQPTTIDANINPRQKSHYINKAFQIMKELDQEDNSILMNRIANYQKAHEMGSITEAQSLQEYVSIEKDLLGKNSFGKDRVTPVQAVNNILKMRSAHINKMVSDRIPKTANGSLANGLGTIKHTVRNHVEELKERYGGNPEIMQYLDTDTLVSSMTSKAVNSYLNSAQKAREDRAKDSASYIQNTDRTVGTATEGLLKEMGSAGAPDPSRLSEYINVVKQKADDLGIPREQQTLLPEQVTKQMASTAVALRDKHSPKGLAYTSYLEQLKAGIPPEDWAQMKDALKANSDGEIKDADFYTVDNFNPEVAGYWQKLNNKEVIEGLKQSAAANPELSNRNLMSKLTDRGYELFGLTKLIGEDAIGEGVLSTNSPIGKAMLGPGKEIQDKVMYDRINEMAVNGIRWEVGQGMSVDDAVDKVSQMVEKAFPTVQGKNGTVIISGMPQDDYTRNTVKDFLNFDHKVSDYAVNFIKSPAIQQQLTDRLGIVDPDEQTKYIDDNYKLTWANSGEGKMRAYLISKDDPDESIPLEITSADGSPIRKELSLNGDDLQKELGKLRRFRDLQEAMNPERMPNSVDYDETQTKRRGGTTPQDRVEGATTAERLNSIFDSMASGTFADYDSNHQYKSGEYQERTMIPITKSGKDAQSKANLLGITKKNKKAILDAVMDPKHPNHDLFNRVLKQQIQPTAKERLQIKNYVLNQIGIMTGNIPKEFEMEISKNFMFEIGADLQMNGVYSRKNPTMHIERDYRAKKAGYKRLLGHFTPAGKGQVSDDMMTILAAVETNFKSQLDSQDNLSAGLLQIASHKEAALAEVMMEGTQSNKWLKKNFPLYAKDIRGVDKTVLAHNTKLETAIAYSYLNGFVYPNVDRKYPNGPDGKGWKKGERDLYASMMYNSGVGNFKKNFKEKKADPKVYSRYNRVKNVLMGGKEARTPQSVGGTFNEPTQTAEIEDMISEIMDKINGNLETIFSKGND
jgi:hypothetical protein